MAIRQSVAMIALVAAALGGAWVVAAWILPGEPVMFATVPTGGQEYVCSDGSKVSVRAGPGRRTAYVTVDGREHRLVFRGARLLGDVYDGGGWTLSLDPEVGVTGPGGIDHHNCA